MKTATREREWRKGGPICDPVTNLLHSGSRERGREGESVARSGGGGGVGGLDECANRSGDTKKVAIAERLLL